MTSLLLKVPATRNIIGFIALTRFRVHHLASELT